MAKHCFFLTLNFRSDLAQICKHFHTPCLKQVAGTSFKGHTGRYEKICIEEQEKPTYKCIGKKRK